MVKDGALYGNIVPKSTLTTLVRDCVIGQTVRLQMISLTDHPCGKYIPYQNDILYAKDHYEKDIVFHPDYPACLPGPMLVVHYIHLTLPAVKVWYINKTSYSLQINFLIGK